MIALGRWFRVWALVCLLGFPALLMTGCGFVREPNLPETTVAKVAGEDMADTCTYALRVANGPVLIPGQSPSQIPQTAVLVVFERLDSLNLFEDPAVIAAAQNLHMAMMYAYQCNASSFDDLQPVASAGPGRALFQALNQFSVSLSHPELANANVFVTGFSAAGYLSVTLAAEHPDRVLGVIPYAPASAYYDLGSLEVSPKLAQVPALILVSAQDTAAGDQRPFFLFLNGWVQGAPWGFASQHSVGHCCVDSIAPMLIPWMTAIFNEYTVTGSSGLVTPKGVVHPAPASVGFQIASDGSFDPFGWQNFYFGSASVFSSALPGEPYQAWLPDATNTAAWLAWVNNPDGN